VILTPGCLARGCSQHTHGRVAEWLKAHAWKACGHASVSWVQIPPRPLRRLGDRPTYEMASRQGRVLGRVGTEGWQNGNAPVSKTGARKGFRVRIPAPPLQVVQASRIGILTGAFTRGTRERVSPLTRLGRESLPLRFILQKAAPVDSQ
jgi:hypothetical protein